VNPRSAIRQAASRREEADREFVLAIAKAYDSHELSIVKIAEAAGITRPTVYRLLRDAGVQLKGAKQ
jgi:AcrR family transcriptional regulator